MKNNFTLRLKRMMALPVLLILMAIGTVSQGQTVTLDQSDLDYAPGETVFITGTGWAPNEAVTLIVEHLSTPIPDHGPVDPHLEWTVTADADGNFTADWYVSDAELGAELLLMADGTESGFTYEIFFTDGQPTFTFNLDVAGIPVAVTVAVSGTKPNGNAFSGTTVVTGAGNDGKDNVKSGSSYTFDFPLTVTNTAVTPNVNYKRKSVDQGSPIIGGVTGVDCGEMTITATHELACTTPTILATNITNINNTP